MHMSHAQNFLALYFQYSINFCVNFDRKLNFEISSFFRNFSNKILNHQKTSKMGRRDKGKKKAVAQGSDVFTMFEKTQLQEFKEAFEMIDSNRDGFIDKNDLKST